MKKLGTAPINDVLSYFVKNLDWKEKIKISKLGEIQIVRPKHPISDEIFAELIIKIDVEQQLVIILLYPDIAIQPDKLAAATVLANEISQCMPLGGHIEILDKYPNVRFRSVINVVGIEKLEYLTCILKNALEAAEDAFSYSERIKAFAAINGSKTIEEIIDKFYNDPDSFPPAVYGDRLIY